MNNYIQIIEPDKQILITEDDIQTRITFAYSKPQDGVLERSIISLKRVPGNSYVKLEKYSDCTESTSISLAEYSFVFGAMMAEIFNNINQLFTRETTQPS